ncbi:MAG: GH39 family glycosyl hydrolase [Lactovum sp.]
MKNPISELSSKSSIELLVNFDGFKTITNQKLIIFLLEGEIELELALGKKFLKVNDMILLDEYTSYKITKRTKSNFIFIFNFAYELAALSLDFSKESLRTSEVISVSDVEDIRELILKIIDLEINAKSKANFLELSYVFLLLDKIISYYSDLQNEKNERIKLILNYILVNYKNSLSLEDIADEFYIDKAYFSRYFKKQMGVNFKEYLTRLRLEQASHELITTKKIITSIALENGFSNLNSFNKQFKEQYQQTPSEYRRLEKQSQEVDIRQVSEKLELAKYELGPSDLKLKSYQVNMQTEGQVIEESWSECINAGNIEMLLNDKLKKQLLIAKNELNIKYVRIWGLFSSEMFVNQADDFSLISYNLNQIFDFFFENKLIPWIDFTKIEDGQENFLSYYNLKKWEVLITNFMKFIVKRYKNLEVEKWFFEFSINDMDTEEKIGDYLSFFKVSQKIVKSILPHAQFGGGAYKPELFLNNDNTQALLDLNADYISFILYPYQTTGSTIHEALQDYSVSAVTSKVAIIQGIVKNHPHLDIYITEWSNTLSNSDILNDHLLKGTYILKTIFEVRHLCKGMFYWHLSDSYNYNFREKKVLYGGNGLMSRNNFYKPAMIAFKFLKELTYGEIVYHDSHLIIVKNRNEIKVLGHYYQHPNTLQHHYNEKITVQEIDKLFDDKKLKVKLRLKNIEVGTYTLRKYSCTQTIGNLLNTWKKFNYLNDLSRSDIKYMKNVDNAELRLKEVEVKNQELKWETLLDSNEFFILNIVKKDINF